ncbi:hypothetical protein lerEdw1_011999 [Lerista edwardsae]|nr:hypothetical protein lerEdw1_011999 [Lerista edwardsae]
MTYIGSLGMKCYQYAADDQLYLSFPTSHPRKAVEVVSIGVEPEGSEASPLKSSIRVVLGQHFFNQSTDITQEFEVEKYIMFPDYTVYNPDEHDIDASSYSKVLQEALVPIIPDYKCQHSNVYGADISENMFCAGYFDGKTDACQGDSGGPLACEMDGIMYAYGIVSWGDGCSKTQKPGVYTKVTKYVNWINGKIGSTSTKQP